MFQQQNSIDDVYALLHLVCRFDWFDIAIWWFQSRNISLDIPIHIPV